MKLYERISLSNLAPALNELRYAGHHLLAAENAPDTETRKRHETRAIGHCERAKYDAKEATIIVLLECVADLHAMGISADEMRAFIPDWDMLIDEASAARSLLERMDAHRDEREGLSIDKAIEKLMDFRDCILAAEANVISLRNKREDEAREIEEYNLAEKSRAEDEANVAKERKEDRRFVASMVLSVAGIVLGIFGLVASVYGIILSCRNL